MGETLNNFQVADNAEREWKSFIFKAAEPENYQDILNHMRHSFYRDEPLNQLTGYSEEKAKDMDGMIEEYFQDGLSHIVVEKGTNQVCYCFFKLCWSIYIWQALIKRRFTTL